MLACSLLLAVTFQGHTVKFDSNRAWEHLRELVAIGPRPAGSPALEQARQYIKDQLAAIGIAATEQRWTEDTPAGKLTMANLVVTVPGARSDRVIIAGHVDTKRFNEFRFVGASDGGSSGAFLLEMARVLQARKNRLTVEVLFLDGEEAVNLEWAGTDHTYGSRHYVEMARRDGTLADIKAVILVDMIGNRDLHIRRDSNSTPWLSDAIWGSAHHLKLDSVFLPCPKSNPRGCTTAIEDDHLPFLKAGVPAVDIIDLTYDSWHTPGDTLEAVSARSLQVVGDVVLGSLRKIEGHASRTH
jgi:glutaminyl-peptide cyclotransferase